MNEQDINKAVNDPALCQSIVHSAKEYVGKLLTSHEAAARIGVSYPTFLRWRRQGKIKGVFVGGGTYRFTEEELGGMK